MAGRVEGAVHRQHADALHVRQELRQELELLGHDLAEYHREPRDIATGPPKARHVTCPRRVGVIGEHDGYGPRGPAGRLHLRRRIREDDVDAQTDQLDRQLGQLFGVLGPPKFEGDVLALDVAMVLQAHPECPYPGC
jgi:hypothetical protein